jgi:uncharacterized protein Smg (DUF494 family)
MTFKEQRIRVMKHSPTLLQKMRQPGLTMMEIEETLDWIDNVRHYQRPLTGRQEYGLNILEDAARKDAEH